MTTAFFLEILFIGLIGLATLYCAVLNARLKRFRGAGNELRGTISELKDTIARAETAIATLKALTGALDAPGKKIMTGALDEPGKKIMTGADVAAGRGPQDRRQRPAAPLLPAGRRRRRAVALPAEYRA